MARARCWADKRSKSKTKTDFENASQWQVVIKYFMIFVNVQLKRMHKFVCHKKCFDFWADTLSTTKRHISCFFFTFRSCLNAWMFCLSTHFGKYKFMIVLCFGGVGGGKYKLVQYDNGKLIDISNKVKLLLFETIIG